MKKIFKDWNLFEISFLTLSLFIILICYLLNHDKNMLSLIVSLLGIFTVICGAKGLIIAPFINIIYNVLYIFISFSQNFYGEVLIYIFLMIPLNIITIISWLKNRSNENKNIVKVNKISKKEYSILIIVTIGILFSFYLLLKSLNTSALIISTFSLADSLIASYLLFRRSSNYAIAFIINDIILILLWLTTLTNGKIIHLPIVITFMIFLINDIYGLIIWKKREKLQS